jgi:DNA mismatch repair protein MutL
VNHATGEVIHPDSGGTAPWARMDDPGPGPDVLSTLFSQSVDMERPAQEYHHDTLRNDVAEIGASIWQVHNKYIMAQIRTGIIIVDQHVAHERVLYEKALNHLSTKLPFSQQLLFPCNVAMSPNDIALVRSLLGELEPLGFALRFFGKDTVVIDAVPHDVRPGNEARILTELIHQARESERLGVAEVRDMVAKTFACKAAIKAGDRLTGPEMNGLIDQLFATQMPYVCPHGRPIVIKIALEELDRRFLRPVP